LEQNINNAVDSNHDLLGCTRFQPGLRGIEVGRRQAGWSSEKQILRTNVKNTITRDQDLRGCLGFQPIVRRFEFGRREAGLFSEKQRLLGLKPAMPWFLHKKASLLTSIKRFSVLTVTAPVAAAAWGAAWSVTTRAATTSTESPMRNMCGDEIFSPFLIVKRLHFIPTMQVMHTPHQN
jgi:hypothetical protein